MKVKDLDTPQLFKIKESNYVSGQELDKIEQRMCLNLISGEIECIPLDVEIESSDFTLTKIERN
jgi:hypothetical protein